MTKYLYGAAVQGIQDFIFQTNELKDIVGASELVEEICTEAFEEFAKAGESIVRAAGNIKHIYSDSEADKAVMENAVRNFPKIVMQKAPGITVSQAVVVIKNENEKDWFKNAVDELEQKLKVQRNKPLQSQTLGFLGTKRSPKTGRPVWGDGAGELIDEAVAKMRECVSEGHYRLCESCFGAQNLSERIAYNINDITLKNDWIAVIHADGNGLGNIIRTIGDDHKTLQKFSKKLNDVTIESAKSAYKEICYNFPDGFIPIRPIVVGGDDFTVICRADFALKYVNEYLVAFETKTQNLISDLKKDNETLCKSGIDKLTACAGIAYIKSSFPFHYGYHLAEKLCEYAKNVSRKNSCLMFHKVQDSFVENFKTIVDRELKIDDSQSFAFGPYFAKEAETNYWKVSDVIEIKRKLSDEEGNKVKSAIRQFIGLLKAGDGRNSSKKRRLLDIVRKNNRDLLDDVINITDGLTRNGVHYYPAYDILSLLSVENQVTKKQK